MSGSRVSPRTPRERATRCFAREERNPVTVSMNPSRDRTKRSEALITEQVLLIKDTQDAIDRILVDIEKESEADIDRREEELQALLNKSQELLVMLQVLMKIRNELAYARLDLEKAIKSDYRVDNAKKRVKWLQQRLNKVLATTRTYCQLSIKSNERENIQETSNISVQLWDRLSESQRQRYFGTRGGPQGYDEQSAAVMEDFARLVIEPSPAQEEKQNIILTKQLPDCKKKKKRKKKSDRPHASSPPLKGFFGTALPDTDLYDGGGDSTPEPLSDAEADDGASESIISSLDPWYGKQQIKGKKHSQQSITPANSVPSDVSVEEKHELLDTKLEGQGSDHGNIGNMSEDTDVQQQSEDIDEYWSMDHHKFEWSTYMEALDPRSWHALGIAVQESFISKDKPQFESNLPWKEKPMKVNSVIDVHKIALDKLLVRLHRMYEAIGQATQATIDPIPKDEQLETVMGKQEEIETPLEDRPTTPDVESVDSGMLSRGGSRDIVLPPLPGTAAASKTVTFPPPPTQQSTSRYTRKRPDKFYPRDSKEWCEDYKSGQDMPKLVTFKPPPIHKKTSNVQSRYLGKMPEVKSIKAKGISDAIKRKNYDWKPQIVKSLIKIMKGMESSESKKQKEEDYVVYDGPKWRRLQDLIGEAGLKSSNSTIAMESARTIGQLNCRHPDVIAALCSAISECSKDARVCYEASKSLILLGTWAPEALRVVIKNIEKGNEHVVAELLYTMTKAKNIPFVDKSTPEFKSMTYILIELVKVNYHDLSFRAAISLGRLCVVEPVSKSYLIDNLSHLTPEERSEALFVLIKQMNCKERPVLNALFNQIQHAYNWKHRLEAADLLIFLGPRDLFKVVTPEEVFAILEPLLWDHANRELRYKISEAITSLGLRHKVCALVLSKLEDPSEDVRAKAVISLATLGMKGGKEMKALLDLLELDSSVYVRIQVVRAFNNLKWNDPRILRSLRERERGESFLSSEARKAIASLTNEGK